MFAGGGAKIIVTPLNKRILLSYFIIRYMLFYQYFQTRKIRTMGCVSLLTTSVAARGCLPPGANVCVAAPANQIGNCYSYGTYNDDVGVDCHEQYTKLGGVIT